MEPADIAGRGHLHPRPATPDAHRAVDDVEPGRERTDPGSLPPQHLRPGRSRPPARSPSGDRVRWRAPSAEWAQRWAPHRPPPVPTARCHHWRSTDWKDTRMPDRPLVAGVDTSTQSCKVVVCDAETGRGGAHRAVRRTPTAPRSTPATGRRPGRRRAATASSTGCRRVAVGGQQHGMVLLDEHDEVVRPALLWNDTRSAQAARDLVEELGAQAWADATGLVPVAATTVSKLRWVATHEPESLARARTCVLPHDWLTGRILAEGATGRPASGPPTGVTRPAPATGRPAPASTASTSSGSPPAPTSPAPAGRRARRGRRAHADRPGGGRRHRRQHGGRPGARAWPAATSSCRSARAARPSRGTTGRRPTPRARCSPSRTPRAGSSRSCARSTPRACSPPGPRCSAPTSPGSTASPSPPSPGAGGLTLLPFLDGERTPNLPSATGLLHGITRANATPENLARAVVEGMLLGLAAAVDAVRGGRVPGRAGAPHRRCGRVGRGPGDRPRPARRAGRGPEPRRVRRRRRGAPGRLGPGRRRPHHRPGASTSTSPSSPTSGSATARRRPGRGTPTTLAAAYPSTAS